MGHIDPMHIKGFQPPVSAEVAAEAKKKLKETSEEDDVLENLEEGDVVEFSETTKQMPEKKKEAFMADAKEEIANLDKDSETFVDDATQKLVNSALKREFGTGLVKNPGYKQMEEVLKRRILCDPRYRRIIESFLGKLLESEEQ